MMLAKDINTHHRKFITLISFFQVYSIVATMANPIDSIETKRDVEALVNPHFPEFESKY